MADVNKFDESGNFTAQVKMTDEIRSLFVDVAYNAAGESDEARLFELELWRKLANVCDAIDLRISDLEEEVKSERRRRYQAQIELGKRCKGTDPA